MAVNAALKQSATDIVFSGTSDTVNASDGWAAPDDGNILLLVVALKANGTVDYTLTLPAGFTEIYNDSGSQRSGSDVEFYVGFKEAEASDTSFTVSVGSSVADMRISALEFYSTDLDLTSRQVNNDATNAAATGTTSQGSGAATPAVADALGIALYGFYRTNQFNGRSYNNGFSEVFCQDDTSSGSGMAVATKVLTDTSSIECTLSTTDAGDPVQGVMLIFDGDSPIAMPARGLYRRRRDFMKQF